MKKVFVTAKQIEQRQGKRPPSYWDDLDSVIVERTDEGFYIDVSSPAYSEFMKKYRWSDHAKKESNRISGDKLWLELHNYKWTSESEARLWFKRWLAQVKKYLGCGGCYGKTLKILEKLKMDFSSDEGFFVSGIRLHNEVNVDLKRPAWGVEKAISTYRTPPGT
jgi:hypothetical protein